MNSLIQKEGRIRTAYDPIRQQGKNAGHWHKWGIDETGQVFPLNDAGRIVDKFSKGVHISK